MNEKQQAPVMKADAADHQVFDWGELTWYASSPLGNCDSMTVGRCRIKAGHSNPFHSHPNCEEVLHLVQGEIEHALGEVSYTLRPGDSIVIPKDVPHRACAVGTEDAIMFIAFSSGDRKAEAAE